MADAAAAKEVPAEIRQQLLEVFSMLDKSGRMVLGTREVAFLMNKLLNRNLDEITLAEIIGEICDSDAPGAGITFDDFVRFMAPLLTGLSDVEIDKKAFEAMDADSSGHIQASELSPLMGAVAGVKMADSKVQQVLKLAAGSDGEVRFEDFQKATKVPGGK